MSELETMLRVLKSPVPDFPIRTVGVLEYAFVVLVVTVLGSWFLGGLHLWL